MLNNKKKNMDIRAYNAKELSKEKSWPDNVHYETVRDRIKKEKHISITFFTRHKSPEERKVYIPYDMSQRIINAMDFYDKFLKWEFIIVKIKKTDTPKEKQEEINNF